ncbi:glycosyltransferase family 4 protein [Vibrio vulnificus]|uniref:glycosyltransferase family 4 protein n=1 Tax=Vibrio vulnificus TaxID=672 RepID=UPI00163CA328|nr:glycosyltransferase family 4 protein [Vibrio vulnificus]EHK9054864.1 glycosyltransferase family 4 protein [Vibrio vulnificus]ELP4436124.1 glycosyltransferase family 4 protein [Vibrio vulnificus]QND99889.1 glycosyltransferase family 4 protein [Vibrio vulnificus]
MKKVLIIFHDSHRLSGASASMLDLIDSLINIGGISISVVFPNDKGTMINEIKQRGLKYYITPYHSCRYVVSKGFFHRSYMAIRALAKLAVSFISAYRFRKVAIDYDCIYSNTTDIYFGMFLHQFTSVKHIWHIREFGQRDQDAHHIIGDKLFYKLLYKKSNQIVTISDVLKKHLLTQITDTKNKVHRVYDDVALLPTNRNIVHKFDKLNLLMVGSISPGKGQEFLIEAIKNSAEKGMSVELSIVGDDTKGHALYLKRKVNDFGIENRVKFLGFRDDVPALRQQFNAAIIASRSEAFGRVTIEAMNANQLVIANDSGANTELIKNGSTGFIFETNNIGSLLSIFEKILLTNDCLVNDITNSGYISSLNYTQNKCGKYIHDLISDL